jgi:hypothetical protein
LIPKREFKLGLLIYVEGFVSLAISLSLSGTRFFNNVRHVGEYTSGEEQTQQYSREIAKTKN